jgi:hypothetical protein
VEKGKRKIQLTGYLKEMEKGKEVYVLRVLFLL